MNWLEDPSLPVQTWQVKDYRSCPKGELFGSLSELGIPIDEQQFLLYAEEASTPEDLADTLWVDPKRDTFDQAYLIIFELWRRLLPGQRSVSILCDELDFLISLYDWEMLDDEDKICHSLIELERILDTHADQGIEPHLLFGEVALYCAHDLESFIYDFAADQIDRDQNINASELIEGFSSYISDWDWLEFLQLRLLFKTDPKVAEAMLARIVDEQKQQPDFGLMLEIARFLVSCGMTSYFAEIFKQVRLHIQTEQDFREMLEMARQFYQLLDKEVEVAALEHILSKRQSIVLEREMCPNDPDLTALYDLLHNLNRSEA